MFTGIVCPSRFSTVIIYWGRCASLRTFLLLLLLGIVHVLLSTGSGEVRRHHTICNKFWKNKDVISVICIELFPHSTIPYTMYINDGILYYILVPSFKAVCLDPVLGDVHTVQVLAPSLLPPYSNKANSNTESLVPMCWKLGGNKTMDCLWIPEDWIERN